MKLAEFYKVCTHERIVGIKNGYDQTVGGQCSTCLKVIWGTGKCEGCGKNSQLRSIVSDKRYCGEECVKLRREYGPVERPAICIQCRLDNWR